MRVPFHRYVLSDENPLGIDEEVFAGREEELTTPVKILEYKYSLDGLIEELQQEVKSISDIGLIVVWEAGTKWRELFDATSYLDPDQTHHRQIHGTTHSFTHSVSGVHAFEAIILQDLVMFLTDRDAEVERQRRCYGDEDIEAANLPA